MKDKNVLNVVSLSQFCETDVYFSFLPLAHIFDRVTEELFISKGAAIGFWHKVCVQEYISASLNLNFVNCDSIVMNGFQDIKRLLDDIKELKPTVFCAVPRVLDRIYSGFYELCFTYDGSKSPCMYSCLS